MKREGKKNVLTLRTLRRNFQVLLREGLKIPLSVTHVVPIISLPRMVFEVYLT